MTQPRRTKPGRDDPADVIHRFRARARADMAAGSLRSLESYLAEYPGHEASIAAEYAHLRAEDPPVEVPSTVEDDVRRLAADAGPRLPLLGEIARGGMGSVLRVRDERLGRDLAMKVLLGEDGDLRGVHGGGDRTFVPAPALRRFLQEAHLTAQLAHPGVPSVHALGVNEDGQVYFTMKLVQGRTLADVFRLVHASLEGWTLTRALQALIRVCETMAYAHARGVIHRDLKPPNVMVGRFGEVYVMDWGLARAKGIAADEPGAAPSPGTADGAVPPGAPGGSAHPPHSQAVSMTVVGTVLGTPSYMSPEQAAGRHDTLDARADVYSLGAMLYELLAGVRPYHDPAAPEPHPLVVVAAVKEGPPRALHSLAPRTPPELLAIVARSMARDPAHRYASAGDLAEDLHRFIEGRAVRAHRTGPVVELRKWIGRNRAVAGLLAATVLLVTGGSVAFALRERDAAEEFLRQSERAEAAADRARAEASRAEGLRLSALSGLIVGEDPGLALVLAVEGATRAPVAASTDAIFAALRDHRELRTMVGHDSYVGEVRPSADGRRILSREWGDQAILWDAETGDILARFHGDAAIDAMDLDSTGTAVLTGDAAGGITLWEGSTGAPVRRVATGTAGVLAVILGRDSGDRLRAASLHRDGTASIRDLSTGELLATAPLHDGPALTAAAAPDLGLVVSVGADGALVGWRPGDSAVPWRVDGHARLPDTEDPARSGDRRTASVESALGGDRFACRRGDRFDLVDAAGSVLRTIPGATTCRVGIGGVRVAVATEGVEGAFVEILDAASGSTLSRDRVARPVSRLALSAKGSRIAALCRGEFEVLTWKAGGFRDVELLRGHKYSVSDIAFLPGGHLASGSNDATVRTWDLARPEDRDGLAWTRRDTLCMDRQANLAVLGGPLSATGDPLPDEGGVIRLDLVSVETGEVRATLPPARTPCYAFLTDAGDTVGLGDETGLRLYETGSLRPVATYSAADIPLLSQAAAALPSGDGSRILVGLRTTPGGELSGYVLDRDGTMRALHRCSVGRSAWSPDSRRILVGNSAARTASLWDVDTGVEVHRFLAHTAYVLGTAWDPHGKFVVTAANDRSPRIWDPVTGALLRRLDGLPMQVLRPAVSRSGVVLLHWGRQVDLFAAATGARVGRILAPDSFSGAWFDASDRIVLREGNGRVRVWPVDPLPLARSRATRRVQASERRLLGIGDTGETARLEREEVRGSPRATVVARDALALLRAGDLPSARRTLERGFSLRPGFPELLVAEGAARAAAAAALPAASAERRAAVAAGLESLRRAAAKEPLDCSVLLREPLLEPLRSDPGFAELAEAAASEPLRRRDRGADPFLKGAEDLVADLVARFPGRPAARILLLRLLTAHASHLHGESAERTEVLRQAAEVLRAAIDVGALDAAAAAADSALAPLLEEAPAPPR